MKIQQITLQAAVTTMASNQSSTQASWDVSKHPNRNKILVQNVSRKEH